MPVLQLQQKQKLNLAVIVEALCTVALHTEHRTDLQRVINAALSTSCQWLVLPAVQDSSVAAPPEHGIHLGLDASLRVQ